MVEFHFKRKMAREKLNGQNGTRKTQGYGTVISPYKAVIRVVLAFLARYHPISVAVPSPYRPRSYGMPLPNVPYRSKKRTLS